MVGRTLNVERRTLIAQGGIHHEEHEGHEGEREAGEIHHEEHEGHEGDGGREERSTLKGRGAAQVARDLRDRGPAIRMAVPEVRPHRQSVVISFVASFVASFVESRTRTMVDNRIAPRRTRRARRGEGGGSAPSRRTPGLPAPRHRRHRQSRREGRQECLPHLAGAASLA